MEDENMSSLTIRLPDDKHQRLKALAASRHISINKLIDELALSKYQFTRNLRK